MVQRFNSQTRGLASIAVCIAGDGAFDPVPGIARGLLGFVPAETAVALGLVPAALQVVLDLVVLAAAVLVARFPAVAVGGGKLVVSCAAGVGASLVVLAPVGVFLGRVDAFRHALARQ